MIELKKEGFIKISDKGRHTYKIQWQNITDDFIDYITEKYLKEESHNRAQLLKKGLSVQKIKKNKELFNLFIDSFFLYAEGIRKKPKRTGCPSLERFYEQLASDLSYSGFLLFSLLHRIPISFSPASELLHFFSSIYIGKPVHSISAMMLSAKVSQDIDNHFRNIEKEHEEIKKVQKKSDETTKKMFEDFKEILKKEKSKKDSN